MMKPKILTLALWCGLSSPVSAETIAILGDSLSTGAGTHPELTFSTADLWRVFNGLEDISPNLQHIGVAAEWNINDLALPVTVWPSMREFDGGLGWVFKHTMVGLSRVYLNTEQYSWGYLAAKARGLEASQILLAAENGARSRNINRQYDSVLAELGGKRPDHLFIFFTGNDLCGPSLDFVINAAEYEDILKNAFSYIERNGEDSSSGQTQVHVMGFLGIMQLIQSPSIQNHMVQAYGEEVSCRDLRKRGFAAPEDQETAADLGLFAMMMPPNPAALCPTLFSDSVSSDETRATIANRIRDFRTKQQQLVASFNERAKKRGLSGLKFHFVDQTAQVIFEGEDIAHDCFHLSVSGQTKIARAVLEHWDTLR